MKNQPLRKTPAPKKRMLLYARVSTEEQTKGNYPSCDSQIEELIAECARRGWEAYREIRDEGYTAASLKRPGLTEARMMVQTEEIDGIMCTWYDRLTRSREFYILDHEFQSHGVEFITIHDAADTRTAAGRFMESMIVAAKTYDRDQTSEKVRTKMRMRLEKGLHQGGLVPFGFLCDAETKLLSPDPDKLSTLEQLFRIYVEKRSDFSVRDWLKAHNVPAPHGNGIWQVATIRDLLCNRRYIAEIEINRKNRDLQDVPEADQYRVVKAHYEPMVPVELFELAQVIRKEKSAESPHRVGRPRSFSKTQCGRVYPLQGMMTCGCCHHSMTPWYVHHKPGKDRKKGSYLYYYICAQQQKQWKQCDHKNMIAAASAESWLLDRISELATSQSVIERALNCAKAKCESQLQPEQEGLALVRAALQENQQQAEQMLSSIASGNATGALWEMLNVKANELKMERERLHAEQRRLLTALQPLEHRFDAGAFCGMLADFSEVAQVAEPEELQRLLRLFVRRVEWMPQGEHRVYYALDNLKSGRLKEKVPVQTNVWSGGPDHRSCELLVFQVCRKLTGGILPDLARVFYVPPLRTY